VMMLTDGWHICIRVIWIFIFYLVCFSAIAANKIITKF